MCAAAIAAAAGPERAAAAVELLVEARPELTAAALGLGEGGAVNLRRFEARLLSDPIVSGRLQARLQVSDGVVVVGYDAAAWAARELEGVRLHFAGGVSRVSGAALTARGWSGELSPGAVRLLDLARSEGWKRVGVLYAAGFEGALPALRSAASARGVALELRAVAGRQAIPEAAQALAAKCDALWVLGDPILTSGAGFDYLIELSLSRRLPLLAPEADMVDAGAYAAWEPDWASAAAEAAKLALGARGAAGWPAAGVALGGAGGRLKVNEVLKRRWSERRPGGGR